MGIRDSDQPLAIKEVLDGGAGSEPHGALSVLPPTLRIEISLPQPRSPICPSFLIFFTASTLTALPMSVNDRGTLKPHFPLAPLS